MPFWPEAGVEPAVHDRVGEGGGEGDGVAQPQHEVERFFILYKKQNSLSLDSQITRTIICDIYF